MNGLQKGAINKYLASGKRAENIKKSDLVFIDIETDFKGKLLNVGLTDYNDTYRHEVFIWQDEKYLYYPADVDKEYLAVLELWRNNQKTPVLQVLQMLKDFTNSGKIFCGYNIFMFDFGRVLSKYFQKYLGSYETPVMCDIYLELLISGFQEKYGLEKLKADYVFKFLTECDLNESHTALSDAMLERFIFKAIKKNYTGMLPKLKRGKQ